MLLILTIGVRGRRAVSVGVLVGGVRGRGQQRRRGNSLQVPRLDFSIDNEIKSHLFSMFMVAIKSLVIGLGVGVTGLSASAAIFTGEENDKGKATDCDKGNGN